MNRKVLDEAYRKKRRTVEAFFVSANRLDESTSLSNSPCGQYQLEVCQYLTTPNAWQYSQGVVTRNADQKVIATIQRNFAHFWHQFLSHPNGNDYLICGEDYQGYNVINLSQETNRAYFPPTGQDGLGFCWTAVYPSLDQLVLAVEGCYWAHPYEVVFYDFQAPESLPFLELHRTGPVDNIVGWRDDGSFELTIELEYRKSDGIAVSALSELEQSTTASDEIDYRVETILIERSTMEPS